MKAGKMDRRLTIERVTVVSGQYGDEETWTALRTVWAHKVPVSESEPYVSDERQAERVVTFQIRYVDVTEQDRVASEDVTYRIVGIREIGRRDGLELRCEAINP
jgi:SPP1 family predicted phage head-tail adaptor